MTEKFLIKNMDDEQIKSELTFTFTRYKIEGIAIIKNWEKSISAIKMDDFYIDADQIKNENEFKESIKAYLNDGGFGCEFIKGAYIKIFGIYEYNFDTAKIFINDMFIDKDPYYLSEEESALAYEVSMEMY